MSTNHIYDPEDLEKLLSSKSFSELLPEEKAFVLQYVDDDLEYDSMRSTYTLLGTLPELEPAISPSEKTRESLMDAFAAVHGQEEQEEENKLFVFWTWFWDTNKSLFARPGFQLASLALLVTFGYYTFNFSATEQQVAEVKSTPTEKTKVIEAEQEKLLKKETVKATESLTSTDANESEQSDEGTIQIVDKSGNSATALNFKDASNANNVDIIESDISLDLLEEESLEPLVVEVEEMKDEKRDDNFNFTAIGGVDTNDELESDELALNEDTEKKATRELTGKTTSEGATTDVILDNSADADLFYDAHALNTFTPVDVSEVQVTATAPATASNQFGVVTEDYGYFVEQALPASNFSHLMGKLYTAE